MIWILYIFGAFLVYTGVSMYLNRDQEENIDPENSIDDTIATSFSLYSYYTQYLYKKLAEKSSGTRLVTFHCFDDVIPLDYCLVNTSCDTLLRMWIKR